MRRNFKRWVALLLAVLMVSSTCLYSTDNFLWATDGEAGTYDAAGGDVTVAEDTAGTDAVTPVEETGPVTETQEIVIPEQPEQAEADTGESAESTEPVQEETGDVSSETAATEVPADVALGQTVEVTPSENVENTYNVTFYRPAVEGGILRVWTEGSGKKDVAYTDGRYTEEVKEGTVLYFEIESTGNYLVDQVMDQNGAVIGAESVNGNVSTYRMVINENKEITIMYKEVPVEEAPEETVKEEKPEEEPEEKLVEDEEKKKVKKPNLSNTLSLDDASTFEISGENIVYVGENITLEKILH